MTTMSTVNHTVQRALLHRRFARTHASLTVGIATSVLICCHRDESRGEDSLETTVAVVDAAQTLPRMVVEEDLRLDYTERQLGNINGLLISSTGNIVAPQQREARLRFFDSAGTELRQWHSSDFAVPLQTPNQDLAGWLGDTLWLADVPARVVTFVTASGDMVRQNPLPAIVDAGSLREEYEGIPRGYPKMMNSSHETLFEVNRPARNETGATITDTDLILVDNSGRAVKRVASIPMTSARFGTTDLPFVAKTLIGYARDASAFAIVSTSFPDSTSAELRLALHDMQGALLRNFRFVLPARPLRKETADSVSELVSSRLSAPRRDSLRRVVAELVSHGVPPIVRVVLGEDKSIWFSGRTGPDSTAWYVLAENGDSLSMVMVPRSFVLSAASHDYVWGLQRDSQLRESIVRLRVAR